jgi:hypothetical protein
VQIWTCWAVGWLAVGVDCRLWHMVRFHIANTIQAADQRGSVGPVGVAPVHHLTLFGEVPTTMYWSHVYNWNLAPDEIQFGSTNPEAIEIVCVKEILGEGRQGAIQWDSYMKRSPPEGRKGMTHWEKYMNRSYSQRNPILLDFAQEAPGINGILTYFFRFDPRITCLITANHQFAPDFPLREKADNQHCIVYFNSFLAANPFLSGDTNNYGLEVSSRAILRNIDMAKLHMPPQTFSLMMAGKPKWFRWCLLEQLYEEKLLGAGRISVRKYDDASGMDSIAACHDYRVNRVAREVVNIEKSRLKTAANDLNALLPLGVDQRGANISSWTQVLLWEQSLEDLRDFYDVGMIALIPETAFVGKDGYFLTEKSLRPLGLCRPFILVSAPYSLHWLRRYGFRTFSPFINETYDTILDEVERLGAVVSEVKRIHHLSEAEKKQLWAELLPIVQTNADIWAHGKHLKQSVNDLHAAYEALMNFSVAARGQRQTSSVVAHQRTPTAVITGPTVGYYHDTYIFVILTGLVVCCFCCRQVFIKAIRHRKV